MKYYKLITKTNIYSRHTRGRIYPSTYQPEEAVYCIKTLVTMHPRDWYEVSEAEYLIQEAEKRYPAGTIFNSRNTGQTCHSTGTFKISHSKLYTCSVSGIVKNCVYDGQWATVVEKPKGTMENKEIIGYKAPMDLFGGIVKAGEVYVKYFVILRLDRYIPKGGYERQALPAEIVETWEPVYKDATPEITIKGYKAEFKEDVVKFGCAEIGYKLFDYLDKIPKVTGNRSLSVVRIGDGYFTREHIQQIAEYYRNK